MGLAEGPSIEVAAGRDDVLLPTVIVSADGADAVVQIVGEVDHFTVPYVRERLDDLAAEGVVRITIDASGLRFLDGSGLCAIARAGRALRERGGSLVLSRTRPIVSRLVEVLGLQEVLTVERASTVPRG